MLPLEVGFSKHAQQYGTEVVLNSSAFFLLGSL